MSSFQQLWGPIAADKPCGEDLSYDAVFLELQTKIRGKEETQFSAAEEPDWREIRQISQELAGRGKHLQVGIFLSAALLQTQGLPGFCEGLRVLHAWLENFWDTLYPSLDPEDNNDPTERVNLLQALSVTTEGDPLRFCERLSHIPLTESPTLGKIDLAQIEAGKVAGEAKGVTPAQLAAALRDTPPEGLQARRDAVLGSLEALGQMEALLGKYIGGGRAPNWEALRKKLEAMRSALGGEVPVAANAVNAATTPATSAAAAGNASAARAANSAAAAPGAIESREDVLAAFDAVCEYYRRREPSSPVPFLVQRARRMVAMDFMQIMGDLAPDSLPQIRGVTGVAEAKPE